MKRACKLSLAFVTATKRRKINALLRRYRSAVNFYIRECWFREGEFDGATLATLGGSTLSERYKSQALKQAVEMVSATRKSAKVLGKTARCPEFHGAAVLDAKFVDIVVEERGPLFDVFVRLSWLVKGKRLTLPLKATTVLRKWLAVPGARLISGCCLSENGIVLWVEASDPVKRTEGDVLAVDVGMCKLVATSEGEFFGAEFRAIRDKIVRRQPGSRGRARAHRERTNFINRIVNQLPWSRLTAIGHEKLHDMKRGKKRGRGKAFRKAISPWVYRQLLTRIDQRAEENGVLSVAYDPRDSSRECPACGTVNKDNRKGELFLCLTCGHAGDADTVGAQNGLVRTLRLLGSVESPRLTTSMI